MIGRTLRRRQVLVAMAAAAAQCGCAESPPPRLFTLASRPGAQNRAVAGIVVVKPVDFPRLRAKIQALLPRGES